jgi:7-cyano-7-deazaguanine synthase
MSRRSIAVLVSGGLDSDVLVADLCRRKARVYPIFIEQGLYWEKVERYWLKRFLKAVANRSLQPLKTLRVPMEEVYGAHWSTKGKRVPGARTRDEAVYLPGRNLTLTVKAAVWCALNKIPRIALASLGQNPFPDASSDFFRRWSRILSQGLSTSLLIEAPYRQSSKEELVKRWESLPLHLSFSCIAPHGRLHCGACNKCAERRRAFRLAKVQDRTVYAKG